MNRWISSGEIAGSSRLVESALAATDVLTLDGHGFETDDPITVRATEGGALSAPLVEGTIYFAIRLTNGTFSLAATTGGSAINLTTDATSMVVTRDPAYDDVIEYYSRFCDGYIPANLVPLQQPIPVTVKTIVARLSGKALMNIDGKSSAIVEAEELLAQKQLERWALGLPIREATATGPSNLAVSARVNRRPETLP